MRPVSWSITRGGRRPEQEGAATGASSSGSASERHANAQLEGLPRRPVREAQLVEPGLPVSVRVAQHVSRIANLPLGALFSFNSIASSISGAYGYLADDEYYRNYATLSGKGALASAVAIAGVNLADYLIVSYLRVQRRAPAVQKADRARELGTTVTCLDEAVEMVTMPDAGGPGDDLTMGEQVVLAKDLLNLITAQRSRLPSQLWNAAFGVREADVLVNRLLAAARDRAAA
ncbi:type III secretion system effector XopAV (plasmid) [Xanthomonas axonopodis pv. vasculorum]